MTELSRRRQLSGVLAAMLAVASPFTEGKAATTSTTMPVTATVLASCTLSAQPLAFGNYQGSQLDATTTIGVSCTNGTVFNVGLDVGSNASGNVRRMLGPTPGQYLNYSVTRDATYNLPWGGTVGTDTVQSTSLGTLSTLQVYGRLAAGQYPAPGAYTDSITVTITY